MKYEQALKHYKKDIYKYIELLEQESDNKDALYRLATIYIDAQGIDVNLDKAKEYLLKAINLESKKSMFLLANLYETKRIECNNQSEFIDLYKKAAIYNHSRSILKLADFYLKGQYVQQNIQLALEYYDKLVSNKYLPAILSLSKELIHGNFIDKNINKAIQLLKLGVSLDSVEAMYLLAHYYILGEDVVQDYSYSKDLIIKALSLSKKKKFKRVLNWFNKVEDYRTNKMYKNPQEIIFDYPYLTENLCTKEDLITITKTHLQDLLKTNSNALILYSFIIDDNQEKINLLKRAILMNNGYACNL